MDKADPLRLFLSLKDFGEYMERFEDLAGLPAGPLTFKKEMQLMETDAAHTHREKEALRQARLRKTVSALRRELELLRDGILREGCWLPIPEGTPEVAVVYRFPQGKNGDIDHAIARELGVPEQTDADTFRISVPGGEYETLELLCFLSRSLPARYDFTETEADPPARFLAAYHRVFQAERLMWKINYYRPQEYRNLRSVGDPVLRGLLQERHALVARKRDEIYERLIAEGATNARWISEQKAYAIVREIYPDALFQFEADWLRGQRLDIYIPSRRAAIEYQGRQHTEAVEFFGGEKGLSENRRRDQTKLFRCRQNGVRLLYWDYSDPLTEAFFRENLMGKIEGAAAETAEATPD